MPQPNESEKNMRKQKEKCSRGTVYYATGSPIYCISNA
jgi:hypothetical protein